MKKKLLVLAITAVCASCAGMDLEEIGVGPEDNAFLIIRAKVDPAWSESTADYCLIELPAGVNMSSLDVQTVSSLLEQCP